MRMRDALKSNHFVLRCMYAMLLGIWSQSYVFAADVISDCRLVDDPTARLGCYDQFSGIDNQQQDTQSDQAVLDAQQGNVMTSSFDRFWELDSEHKRGAFRLLPYRTNYLLPFRYADHPNERPSSPAEDHDVIDQLPLDNIEVKFQFSVRFKVWENALKNNGDIWFGYTQQSNWQLYNGDHTVSSAFRETNYEPEAFIALRTDRKVLGWYWRMLNLGFVHQSNGRELPLSRSWNRVYAQFTLLRGDLELQLRPWIRVPEKSKDDDNPDIHRYMGSGDIRLSYVNDGYIYSLLGRYSASGRRGALQLDWAFPISGSLKGYAQLFSGYGDSLIDYNHSETVFGIGVLLVPWS